MTKYLAIAQLLLFVSIAGNVRAQSSIRLDAHRQARTLANELVASVFDSQLRHLDENGLDGLPIYAEIRTSRDRIEQLASVDMKQLTRLLTELQHDDVNNREELIASTRVAARRIAVAMMAQRQRLRGRLRASRTMLLVRQMMTIERQAIDATDEIKSQANAERLIQSQLDQEALLEQLTQMLRRSNEMLGQERIVATAALQRIESREVKAHIAEVVVALKSDRYEDAIRNEQHVLATLEQLLQLLQQGEQLEEEARREALEAIARTVKEQQDLRQQTEASDLSKAEDRETLTTQQRRIVEQLDNMRDALSQLAAVGEQMLAAKDAAEQAAQHLDQSEKEQATERQETVLNMLEDIAQHLKAESTSPEAMAERAAQLEELSESLNELLEQQSEASELAKDDPEAAAEIEAEIGQSLEDEDDASSFGKDVESRLEDAQQAVAEAEGALQDKSPDGQQNRMEATENAEQALMEAAAEVQSQLTDAKQAMEQAKPSESNTPSDSTAKNEASSGTNRDSVSTLSERDAEFDSRNLEQAAWFARLPAALQNRIRAATRRPPPRGYETRLQRYFELAD
jgi:hypothetical protein